ncbi:response regulator [Christiangramia sediminis]|uniref:Response regulator n=1 Tax=Christiangramia sediminis TaxID=2881336 RepID=A0A9X1LHI8_9FLAO|nr:response regulator [Christiangramia sediminis]MCB7480465.1 response regulator [Christiangramia sediminis]
MPFKSIYVIDDDEIFQFMIRRSIKAIDENIKVKVCSNGKKAIAELKNEMEEIPDIILLDINMPVMDGWEFLRHYSKVKSKVKKDISIYMVSSSANPSDIDKAKDIQILSGYIPKPIDRNELKKIITETPENHWKISYA